MPVGLGARIRVGRPVIAPAGAEHVIRAPAVESIRRVVQVLNSVRLDDIDRLPVAVSVHRVGEKRRGQLRLVHVIGQDPRARTLSRKEIVELRTLIAVRVEVEVAVPVHVVEIELPVLVQVLLAVLEEEVLALGDGNLDELGVGSHGALHLRERHRLIVRDPRGGEERVSSVREEGLAPAAGLRRHEPVRVPDAGRHDVPGSQPLEEPPWSPVVS